MTANRRVAKLLVYFGASVAVTVASVDLADAQFRFQPKLTQQRAIAPSVALKERVRVVPPKTVGRKLQDGNRQAGNRPPKDSGDTIGKPPKSDRPKRDDPPKTPNRPPRQDTADKGRPRPPKIVTPPVRVVCVGGKVVRNLCVCPSRMQQVSRGDGSACVTVVVRPPRPSFPVVVVPMPPSRGGVTTFVPEVPPSLPPSWSPPPPNMPRPMPQSAPPPFVPSAAIADSVFVPDEVIFAIGNDTPQSLEDGVAQRFNLALLERSQLALTGQRIVRLRIPDGRLVPAVVAALQQDGAVIAPQPNYLYRPQQASSATSQDPLQYALAKVELVAAHQLATGRGAVVGIIDTGIDVTHADLKDSDIRAFDAAGGDGAPDAHGTSIAGIISAKGLTRGIAPGARVLSVRAFNSKAGGGPQLTTSYILLKSIDWAVQERAKVLNLSFAGPEDPMLRKAISAADARGVIMVAAAGNSGRQAPAAYPAAYASVIGVTAVDAEDRLYAKANVGAYVAIAAPGVEVLAPTARGAHDLQSGTSFAAAHITGIVALMLERQPELLVADARAALASGAVDLGKVGLDEEYGAGRVNAAAALQFFDGKLRN